MSIDGLLPAVFSRKHKTFKTPFLGLVILCVAAYVASLLGGLTDLISSTVFLLGFAYLATCISTILLGRKHPRLSGELRFKRAVPLAGAAFSIALMALVSPTVIAIAVVLLAVGIPIYVFFSPRKELEDLKAAFLSADAISTRAYRQGRRFLAFPLVELRELLHRRVEH